MNDMSHSHVRGVVILARNGDRTEFYQDPKTYKPKNTHTTPLGAAQSYQLGDYLRKTYLAKDGVSHIDGISGDIVNTKQIYVRAKAGGEGVPVIDNGIALLQGLFPPTPKNSITLANGTTVTTPLGGYQYVPVETVEPQNDRSLEPWTDCPNFEKHVAKVLKSEEFAKKASEAAPFLRRISDFVWGVPVTYENIWNVYDYVHAELTHNKTYAYRLPPSLIEQSRGHVNWHQNKIFSDAQNPNGIGNIAGQTVLHSIIKSLQDIAFDGNPLKMLVQETTYQPFISLAHILELVKSDPQLAGLPNYASALAIELRRGSSGDDRDYLRFKFKNGTVDSDFRTVHAFGHREDIPLTEFIYRAQKFEIKSNREWAAKCRGGSLAASVAEAGAGSVQAACGAVFALLFFCALFFFARARKARRTGYIRIGEVKA